MQTIKYATPTQWCRISGMTRTPTYEALASGKLRGVKLGRKTLIDVEHGLAWLSSLPAWQPSGPVATRRTAIKQAAAK